jgi:hypothetical protein
MVNPESPLSSWILKVLALVHCDLSGAAAPK